MTEQEEKRNQRTGMIVSIGLHAALLILFFFLLAWREPNPPLPEYGIELNFGVDNVGSGTEQSPEPPSKTESTEEAKPQESPASEIIEEQEPEPEPEVETAEPEEQQEQEVSEPEVTEPEINEPEEEIAATQPTEAPVEKKKEPVVKKEVKKPEPEKPVTKPVTKPEKPVEKQVTEKKVPKPAKKVAEKETDTSGGADGNKGESTEAKASNQGNDKDKAGDKGDPEGSLDARALYGTKGGGDGPKLDMTGWDWDFMPDPDDPSNESGRIVFEIIIDDRGEIMKVETIESTVIPAVERIYKREVERLTFSKTSDNTIPAPTSTGRITFIIKAK